MTGAVVFGHFARCDSKPAVESVLLALRVTEDKLLWAVRTFHFQMIQQRVSQNRDWTRGLERQEVFLDE
jgi:hypothetical protein